LQVIDLNAYFYHLNGLIFRHKSRTYTTHQGLRVDFAQSFAQSYPQGGMKAHRLMKLVYWME
jgi:hypothetical protein